MLVLSRKVYEEVIIDVDPSQGPQQIRIMVVEMRGDKTKLGFTADANAVTIHRAEIHEKIQREKNNE